MKVLEAIVKCEDNLENKVYNKISSSILKHFQTYKIVANIAQDSFERFECVIDLILSQKII